MSSKRNSLPLKKKKPTRRALPIKERSCSWFLSCLFARVSMRWWSEVLNWSELSSGLAFQEQRDSRCFSVEQSLSGRGRRISLQGEDRDIKMYEWDTFCVKWLLLFVSFVLLKRRISVSLDKKKIHTVLKTRSPFRVPLEQSNKSVSGNRRSDREEKSCLAAVWFWNRNHVYRQQESLGQRDLDDRRDRVSQIHRSSVHQGCLVSSLWGIQDKQMREKRKGLETEAFTATLVSVKETATV